MTQEEKSILAKRIGLNVTNLLIRAQKNQDDLAKALGVSKATISLWCSGRRTPRMDHVDKIAQFFGTTRSAILEDSTGVPQLSDQMRDEINRLVDERLQAAGTTQNQSEQFYDNETVQIVTDRLRKNPEYAVLFKAASNLKPEDVEFVTKFIEKMS